MEPRHGLVLQNCVLQSNQLQQQIKYEILDNSLAHQIKMQTFQDEIIISEYLDMMERLRAESEQQDARILTFVNNYLIGTVYSNLFAGRRSENGVGVITTCNVEGIVIPEGKLNAYFQYLLAKAAMDLLNPHHEYHSDGTRTYCVYDYKINKSDIAQSMRSRPLCDECRALILLGDNGLDPASFNAIDKLFALSGRMLEGIEEA